MRVKKYYGAFIIVFEIVTDSHEIAFEKELSQICSSFEDVTLLDKRLPFNDLVKLQQKYHKNILVSNDIKPFDEIRLLLKFLTNFLIITEQANKFSIETLHYRKDDEIIAYGTEIFYGDIKSITFSPTARLGWSNPQLIDDIIQKG